MFSGCRGWCWKLQWFHGRVDSYVLLLASDFRRIFMLLRVSSRIVFGQWGYVDPFPVEWSLLFWGQCVILLYGSMAMPSQSTDLETSK